MKITRPDVFVLLVFIVLTFIGSVSVEYYQYGYAGAGATVVGYIFGWSGKKWYDEAKRSSGGGR